MYDYIVKYLTAEGRIMEWETSGDTPEEAVARINESAGEELGTFLSVSLL